MKIPPRAAWAWVSGVALAGFVAAHSVSYGLVHPDPHERAATLHLSGHGYWDLAVTAALVVGVAAVLARTGAAFLAGRSVTGKPAGLGSLWARLTVAQVGIFLAAEVAERLVSGTIGSIASEWAVWLGVPILLLVALIGALVLRVAEQAGLAISRRMRRPGSQSTAVSFPTGRISVVRSALLGRGRRTRAPPLPVAS